MKRPSPPSTSSQSRRGAVWECQHGYGISMDVGLHVPTLIICKSKFYHLLFVFPLKSNLSPWETGVDGSCQVPQIELGVSQGSHRTSCWPVLWAHTFLRNCWTTTDPDGSSSRDSFSVLRARWKLSCWGSPLILVLKTRKYRAQWAAHDNCLSLPFSSNFLSFLPVVSKARLLYTLFPACV